MRQIRIDRELTEVANRFSDNLFNSTDKYFKRQKDFVRPLEGLKRLILDYPPQLYFYENLFLNILLCLYRDILRWPPSKLAALIKWVDDNLKEDLFIENGRANTFGRKVLNAMRYESLREKECFYILDELKIKTCCYCNSQLAITITKGKKRKARLELDHFFPKSKYPFLATSFFNLIPVCSNCNKVKGNQYHNLHKHYHLFTKSEKLNPFEFIVSKESIVKYWTTRNKNKINFKFSTVLGYDNHDEIFSITEIYNTQKDIVEELLHKQYFYNKARKRELLEFKKLFPDKAILNRMIVGNYSKKEEINGRPLAKFTQDIARQLKLIE